ncbi:MAG: ATP-binding protein [Deltaproteobacteria bacterium]|nr:ATP-binding protein [Deltaproteobacteria bacterium]
MNDFKRFFSTLLQQRLTEEQLPFIQVLIGPRQVGKSTAIAQVAATWTGPKIIESADHLNPPNQEWVAFQWQRALEQHGICLLALDEIQKVENWAEIIKKLFDRDRHKNKLRIVLSGSASLKLQHGLSESLAGRYELIRCPHWGLDECQKLFGWDAIKFLKFGGYPSTALYVDDLSRWQGLMRDSIIEPVLSRDLQTAVTIQKPALLRQLFALAMHYPAQEISYQKLLGQLQDRGNTATISHYMHVLSGGFLLATLDKYVSQVMRQKASSPKIIPLAPALIHAFSSPDLLDSDPEWRGRVFEAAIGAHLVRVGEPLYYWRDGDHEIDFVIDTGRQLIGIEVKSGRRKRQQSAMAFKKKFANAQVIFLDWMSGTQFLEQQPTLENLLRHAS